MGFSPFEPMATRTGFPVKDMNHQQSYYIHRDLNGLNQLPSWVTLEYPTQPRPAGDPGPNAVSFIPSVSQELLGLQSLIHSGSRRNVFFVSLFRHVPHLPA